MSSFFPAFCLLCLAAVTLGQNDRSALRRPSFSRVNSRPVVIRLPARRPRIRPLPALSSSNSEKVAPRSRARPPLPVNPPVVRPRPSRPRPPPPAPVPPPPAAAPVPRVGASPPIQNLSPTQLNQLLGLAGLNSGGTQAGGVPKLPDLSSLAGSGLFGGRNSPIATASGLPNLNAPGGVSGGNAPVPSPKLSLPSAAAGPTASVGAPPPGTFGSGGPIAPPPLTPRGQPDVNNPLPATVNSGSQGLLGVLQTLAKQFTQSTGLGSLIPGQQAGVGAGGAPGGGSLIPGLGRLFSGNSGGPLVPGLPRIPGVNLPDLSGFGGAPQNSDGKVDVVNLISSVTQRFSNGSTLSEILPPGQVQGLADNLTEALLPETADIELGKFMGRWFEGINSPRNSDQRCVVHHCKGSSLNYVNLEKCEDGGLTKNGKTATFTALKIYREGSEFGQVRYSIGYAFRGGHRKAMLQMHSSETTEPAPYWIYRVGPEGEDPFGNNQYEYAIVSNWVKYPVVVLVRDPDKFKQQYEVEVLRWLEDNGFINGFVRAFNLLQPVSYENCQYADSTFEVFG